MIFSNNIYKIRLWSLDDTSQVFVFLGTNVLKDIQDILKKIENKIKLTSIDIKTLDKQFGKDYKKNLGMLISNNPIFLYNTINHDDNINILSKKIIVYLDKYIKAKRPEDIYVWCNKHITKGINIDSAFINNCFKKDSKIKFEYFQQCVKNYFDMNVKESGFNMIDKQIAFKLLSNINTTNIIEPLLFKYIYDGFFEYIQYNPVTVSESKQNFDQIKSFTFNSYSALTLSSFEINDNLLELITTDNMKDNNMKSVYFPLYKTKNQLDFQALKQFIKQLDDIEKEINYYTLQHKYKTETYITFLSLKGNDMNFNSKINLAILFDKIHANKQIQFIKFKSNNNIFYKADKESLIKITSKDLDKWTIYKSTYGKFINSNYIILKIHFGNHSYCTVTLSDTLGYDIKFNIGVDEKIGIETIHDFYNQINDIIKFIQSLYPDLLIPLITVDNLKIINMVTYNIIGLEKKTVKFDNIEKIISSKMYPYFNIIPNPDKNILHLQYKKVDNYVKFDNINAFITMHFGMPKDKLIIKLMELYVISKEEAEKEYDKWSNKNEIEFMNIGETIKIKPKNDNFVNLKLKVNEIIDTKFIISGLKDYYTQNMLVNLVQIILDLTNQKIPISKIDLKKFDAQMFDEQKTITFNDIEKENIYTENEYDDLEENQDDIDPDFLALEMEFEQDINSTKSENINVIKSPNDKLKKGKAPGPILGFLKEADRKLFEYQIPASKKRTDYPSLCGWTDTRQPMVITAEEKKKIDTEFPSAYDGYIKTGSTKELANKNYYICPKIWCPKSRIAMSYTDYKKNGNKCPYPEIEEEPILFNKTFWGKDDDKALSRSHYIGFLKDSTHPNHFCLPCCFKLPPSVKKKQQEQCKTNYNDKEKLTTNTAKNSVLIGNEKYIKGENYFPLEPSRFGLLPKELTELLGNKKCGDRHDGTGLLENGTECFLRKGITHTSNSFISCMLTVLDLSKSIKTSDDFLNLIIKNLDIYKYLTLENGKIIRLFINNSFDIHNNENFKEFYTWFMKQSSYILKYNLYKVKKDLESLSTIIFSKKLFTYKDVIREFMIYNSFKHFIIYLKNPNIIKDHRTLLDLINTEHQDINIHKIHIIIIDVDPKTNKTVLLCPFNRNVKQFIHLDNPFVFIIKNNEYYEPLCYIEYKDGPKSEINTQYEFIYTSSDDNMQSIIKYYMNNCGSPLISDFSGETIAIFLESIGYPTKSYVIDFSFRVRGILLKNNLFIPFKDKLDVYHVIRNSFIYFNDIVDFKCLISKEELIKIFNHLVKFTNKNTYYKINKFIRSKDDNTKLSALILNSKDVIPLRLNHDTPLYRTFENDLDIFIDHQGDDKRTLIMKTIKENTRTFNVFFQSVMSYINNDESIRNEIEFLINLQNPFPKNFRRNKLLDILQKISKDVIIKSNESHQTKAIINDICENGQNNKNCVYHCDVDDNGTWNTCLMGIPDEFMIKFVNRMIETLLLGQNMNITTKIFSSISTEILLDQHDINNNKIQEIIEYQKNPFKLLSERLEDITDSYIFDVNINIKSLSQIYINDNSKYDVIPVIWRKLLKNFEILLNPKYNPMYLYSLFININEFINPQKQISIEIIKGIIKSKFIHDYPKDNIIILFNNESFKENIKILHNINKISSVKPSINMSLDVIDSVNYYPSLYEVKILADIIGINIIVIGRKTISNPDGIELIYKNAHYTIILLCSYDRINKYDRFELFIKNKKIIIYKTRDIPSDFYRIIENKKKTYEINISE